MVATFFFPSLAPVSGWRLPESLIFLARRLCHLKQQGCEMRTGEKKMGGCTIVEGWRWPRKSFSATHGEKAADVRRLDLSRTAPLSHLSQGLVTSQTNLGLYCITFQPGKLMGEGLLSQATNWSLDWLFLLPQKPLQNDFPPSVVFLSFSISEWVYSHIL